MNANKKIFNAFQQAFLTAYNVIMEELYAIAAII